MLINSRMNNKLWYGYIWNTKQKFKINCMQ